MLVITLLVSISLGSVSIPMDEIIAVLSGNNSSKSSWSTIILHSRLPKAITAMLVGSGLSIAGLLMQTLFKNPLAGPFVLGISSGASLGVAILILGAGIFGGVLTAISFSSWGLAIASSLGAAIVLLAVLITAHKVRNTMSILIIGLMFGSFASAIISVLSYFSEATKLQQFLFWSFGSLGIVSWNEIIALFSVFIIGITLVTFIIKPLNSLHI